MKTTTKSLVFGIFVSALFITSVSGQTYKPEQGNTNGEHIIRGEKVSPEMMANLGIMTAHNLQNAIIHGNPVYVRQIGDFNTDKIVSNPNASVINLLQNWNHIET